MTEQEKITEMCRQHFETHQASLIQNTDRYLIIDWRRRDGSGNCYVNYIVDKKRGSLIVSGDLGASIATWYNPLEPSKLKEYIHNDVGYYISKLQCESDLYTYDGDNIVEDMKKYIDSYDVKEYIAVDDDFDNEEEFWDHISEETEKCMYYDKFIPSSCLTEKIEKIDADCWEWLSDCGKRVHMRVYLWAEGFYMACSQLGI